MKLYRYDSKSLQFKKFPISTQAFKALFTAVLIFMFLGMSTTEIKTEYVTNTEDILLVRSNREFSEEKLVNLLKELNLPYPHITLAQAKLETGNFTSKIFNENHNSFGQKEAKVRINLAKGTQYGHAYYNNWEESILDYAFWYSTYASKCKSEEEFYQLLDKVYAEDELYSKKLKNIIEEEQLKDKF